MDNIDYNMVKGAVLTIGNFDGVHVGHRKLIDTVIQCARQEKKASVLYTFSPHPVQVLSPEKKHQLLYSAEKNKTILQDIGLDYLIVEPFTRDFSKLSPEGFVEQYIVNLIQPTFIVVGYNFRFGTGSKGSSQLLEKLKKKHDFRLKVVPPVKREGIIVSSSVIKKAVLSGNWDLVPVLLGRFFSIEGSIVKGAGRGRRLGFPTINLKVDADILLPVNGVYTARIKKKNQYFQAIVNIGQTPTFSDDCLKKIEVHLIGKSESWKDKKCEVEILRYIRPEYKFPNSKALIHQIKRDIVQARLHLEQVQ